MAIGKTETKTAKSSKDLETTYEVCKKLGIDGGLLMKSDTKREQDFELHFAEPMKWLSTNYPNNIKFIGEIYEDSVTVRLEAYSNGVSITQSGNTARFLDNYWASLSAYL
jgi:hypothetical protein